MRRFCFAFALVCFALCLPVRAQPQTDGYRIEVHPERMPALHIHVEESGAGPPVLMLHGLAASSYTWRGLAQRLAAQHRLIAIDLRGHGRSDKPFDQHYSPAEHAAVVRAFMHRRGLTLVTVAGHSFGGFIALLLAMDPRSRHRIDKLVLLATPAFHQPYSPAVRLMQAPVLPYFTMHTLPPELPTAVALIMEQAGLGRITGRDIAVYADPLLEPGGPHALIATARQLEPPDIAEIIRRYPSISQRALVIHCRQDDVVPLTSSLRLSLMLPRAKLHVLEECAHIPPEQATDAVAQLMVPFLGR